MIKIIFGSILILTGGVGLIFYIIDVLVNKNTEHQILGGIVLGAAIGLGIGIVQDGLEDRC